MKRLRLKGWVKNTLMITLLYGVIIMGIVALNWRCGVLNDGNDVNQWETR